MQKEAEAMRIAKQQKVMETRQALAKQFAHKKQKQKINQTECEIELKLLQRTDEAFKRHQEELQKAKQQEIQSQKNFLKVDNIDL